ncbi:MAG TPA: DUF4345 family protein [Hyphomonadaceae bacterium]|nr:DUF4345 family protein [Hyphomonadaceae bacterium]
MQWTSVVALLACVIGGGLGGYALINPRWASKLVRLIPKEGRIEGKSEFRATYGGLFLGAHAFAFWVVLAAYPGAEFAAAGVGAAWLGSGLGRIVSIALDKTGSGLNWFNVAFEAVLGLMLLSPLFFG